MEAAWRAPSECNTCFDIDRISADEAIKAFIKAINSVFSSNAHQDSYWKEVALDTEMSISRSVIGYRDIQLESHTRESLLSPVLNQITARMTPLPSCDVTTFDAFQTTG